MIKETDNLFFLYRRSEKKFLQDLYENGELYIRTIDEIRKSDENQERSDPHDGIKTRVYNDEVEVKLCKIGSDIEKEGITLKGENCVMTLDNISRGNIYCFSGIYTKHLLDKRETIEFNTSTFGESLIVIFRPGEFIKRVKDGLKQHGFVDVQSGPVEYYPNNYTGPVNFFRKHERLSYQNEFRFVVPNQLNTTIKISIGSLSDIAVVFEKSCFLELTLTDNSKKNIKLL